MTGAWAEWVAWHLSDAGYDIELDCWEWGPEDNFVLKMSGALSQRIGHSDVAFTMKQYVQADLEADRQVATTLAELIIGGSLASMEIGTSQGAA